MTPLPAGLNAAWLFLFGLSAGAFALEAVVRIANGEWARALIPDLNRLGRLLPLGAAGLALLALFAPPPFPSGGPAWIAGRDILAAILLTAAGERFRRKGDARSSIVYLLVYVVTMSLLAFDRVLALAPWEPITVLPAGYMVGSLLSALALATLLALRGPTFDRKARYDAGALLFALTTFWAYLLWSAFLPAWYGNLPDEAEPFLARAEGGFFYAGAFALGATVVLPFGLLIRREGKESRFILGITAALITVGFAVERCMLVLPAAFASR